MSGNVAGMLVAALAFGVTFLIVRVLAGHWRKRRAEHARTEAAKGQSRQVRRAEERRAKR